MIGVLLIGAGYLAVIVNWGWRGLAVVVAHLAVMLMAS